MPHRTPPALLAAVVVSSVAVLDLTAAGQRQPTRELPSVRALGAALAEFDDGVVHAVAAYYHSQRNHDTPWLLVELGLHSRRTVRVHRESIELETPDGAVVRLASHRQWTADVDRAARLFQSAAPTRHQVRSYFREYATFTALRFVQPPRGTGTVVDFADLTQDQVFLGDLVFEAPTGAWARGDYVLAIHNAASTARLPVALR